MSGGRQKEPRISDPATHPRSSVCLRVAAEFLGMDIRTLRKRIQLGQFPEPFRDGKIRRVHLADIIAYDHRRRLAS